MSILPPTSTKFGMINKEELLEQIVKEISNSFKNLFVTKAHIALVDAAACFHYVDNPFFDQYLWQIQNYVKDNFHKMSSGDCTIPFGGMNLAFFKISEKCIIILLADDGPSGQLLAFKAKMWEWAPQIDEILGEFELDFEIKPSDEAGASTDSDPEVPFVPVISTEDSAKRRRDLKRVPLLIKPLEGKEKFPLEDLKVLQYCDGTLSVEEICQATLYSILRVNMIIRTYEKKKWLKVLRIL